MEKAKSEPVANDTPVAALFQLYAPELLNYAEGIPARAKTLKILCWSCFSRA